MSHYWKIISFSRKIYYINLLHKVQTFEANAIATPSISSLTLSAIQGDKF